MVFLLSTVPIEEINSIDDAVKDKLFLFQCGIQNKDARYDKSYTICGMI